MTCVKGLGSFTDKTQGRIEAFQYYDSLMSPSSSLALRWEESRDANVNETADPPTAI